MFKSERIRKLLKKCIYIEVSDYILSCFIKNKKMALKDNRIYMPKIDLKKFS